MFINLHRLDLSKAKHVGDLPLLYRAFHVQSENSSCGSGSVSVVSHRDVWVVPPSHAPTPSPTCLLRCLGSGPELEMKISLEAFGQKLLLRVDGCDHSRNVIHYWHTQVHHFLGSEAELHVITCIPFHLTDLKAKLSLWSSNASIRLKWTKRLERGLSRWEHWWPLQRTVVWFPEPTWWLTPSVISVPGNESYALFWSLWAPGMYP